MHTLPGLAFKYDALEPYFDARTMELHHTKHHQAYIDKLNEALKEHADLQKLSVTELLQQFAQLPESVQLAVRNHGGGHANHSLFWQLLSPDAVDVVPEDLKLALAHFGSFSDFKEQFAQVALSRFGSGWAWLVVDTSQQVSMYSTANQDSPLMEGLTPILGLDVWEHAYYLKYQNRRADYIAAFWRVLNWAKVAELYRLALQSSTTE